MAINSKAKGAKGERELASKLKSMDTTAERTTVQRIRRRRCSRTRLYTL